MTKFTFLGAYDRQGTPYATSLEPIAPELLSEIATVLPNGASVVDTHPDWIRKSTLSFVEPGTLSLTFVGEGAGYKNALSYYIYDTANPPAKFKDVDDIFVVFPNASAQGSGGGLVPGTTVRLASEVLAATTFSGSLRIGTSFNYTFPAGKSVAFVIHSNKWQSNANVPFLITGRSMYSSDPTLNPEPVRNQHFVNFRSTSDPTKIIYGGEDVLRTKRHCDHDFNDVTFYVTPTPLSALLPNYNSTVEQTFQGTVLCEDLVEKSDVDYNDFCVEYQVTEVLDGAYLTTILFQITSYHNGASLDHEFGAILPHVKNLGATVEREHEGKVVPVTLTSDRVPLVVSTKAFMVNPTCRLKITFPPGVTRADLGDRYFPYNFYLHTEKKVDLFSDVLYPAVSAELKQAGVLTRHKILILEGVTGLRPSSERRPLHKAYYKLLAHLQGDSRYTEWYVNRFVKDKYLGSRTIVSDPTWTL